MSSYTNLFHGYITLRRAIPLEDEKGEMMGNSRKRRAKNQSAVVAQRPVKRFERAYCDYVSFEQYLVVRHSARTHEQSIEPKNCEFCEFETKYSSNLKRQFEQSHKNNNNNLNSESESSNSLSIYLNSPSVLIVFLYNLIVTCCSFLFSLFTENWVYLLDHETK